MSNYRNAVVLFILAVFYFHNFYFAQNTTDSLLKVLKSSPDTGKVNIYLELADKAFAISDFEEAEKFYVAAEQQAAKISSNASSFKSALRYAWFHYRRGNFPKSIHKAEQALKLSGANSSEAAEAIILIGMNTGRLGNFKGALEHYQKALPNFEKTNNAKMLSMVYTNIAGVYFDQMDFGMAIDYFKKSLALARTQNNKKQIGSTLNNIAAALQNQKKNKEAKEYYLQAVEVNEESNNSGNLAYNYMNLAEIELSENNLQKAMDYNKRAGEIFFKNGDNYSIVQILCQQANLDLELGKKQQAIAILKKALAMADSTGSPLLMERTLRQLAAAYSNTGDYKNATLSYEQYIVTKDSIINEEVRNAVIKNQMQFEFDKQLLADSLQTAAKESFYRKEIETKEKEAGMQRKILFASVGAFILMLGLALVIYRSHRQSKRAGQIISMQKQKVEDQKLFLEIKNKEILDSINYAKSIQLALLPNEKMLDDLLKDYFVFFKPRDIVSGDFYWAGEKNGKIFIAVADCTGHGVPGAFMSMLGISLLNEIVIEKSIEDPAAVMEILRQRVIMALKQEGSGNQNKDGMDISLCRIDRMNSHIVCCSAVLRILVQTQEELKIIRGDKQPIGMHGGTTINYTNHTINYKSGDLIYMMTDGFADQFGGETKKKFKFKALYQLLNQNSNLSVKEQKSVIQNTFDSWKAGVEQVDDVLVMGIRI